MQRFVTKQCFWDLICRCPLLSFSQRGYWNSCRGTILTYEQYRFTIFYDWVYDRELKAQAWAYNMLLFLSFRAGALGLILQINFPI